MDSFPDKTVGYTWGIRLIFWWSIFAVIFMVFAWIYALRKFKTSGDDKNVVHDDMNQSMGDLVIYIIKNKVKLEIMRRMTYAKSGI
jgi:hypothetical protein